MKPAAVFAALFSTLTLAGPVKRDLVTEYEVKTLTIYVPAAAVTALPHDHHRPHKILPSTTTALVAASSQISKPAASGQWVNEVNYNGLSDYAAPILKQHNVHRDNHSVPALEWDEELVGLAKQIADTCVYAHSNAAGDGKYGQNIGAGAPPGDIPKMITNDMYNGEINAYPGYGGEPDMSNFHVWGHFSQIVWKDTQKVGCYTTKCASLANVGGNVAPYFTVCNYRPAGNYGGQYAKNVLKPKGDSSVTV